MLLMINIGNTLNENTYQYNANDASKSFLERGKPLRRASPSSSEAQDSSDDEYPEKVEFTPAIKRWLGGNDVS